MSDPDTLFSKILNHEVPAKIAFQDDQVTAFWDINPQAPVHILIVPNRIIPTVNDVSMEDEQVLGHMFVIAAQVAADHNIAEDGYRLIINCGRHGNQIVFHLHMHLLGGEPLGPMRSRPR